MKPLVLKGDNLGQKHENYNKLVQEALYNKQAIELKLSGDDDIQNLLKIDIACKTRNIEFLLEVLKSDDSFYVSRAIKKSKWLIVDKQYSHIVNPVYLHTELLPRMTTAAFNKLMLSIRLNLKDSDRVEEFYKYIAEKDRKFSFKWLQHCSVTFIENEIRIHGDSVPLYILRRLVEKSMTILLIMLDSSSYSRFPLVKDTIFLEKTDIEKYLDAVESHIEHRSEYINRSRRTTTILMTRCPDRILDKFEFYSGALHLPTFVKHLKEKQDIQTFLLKHAQNEKLKRFYTYSNMEPFIKHMSKDNKFEFVKKIFIHKEYSKSQEDGPCDYNWGMPRDKMYRWYKFAPFDEAFTDLKKLIRAESSAASRSSMLQVLISCAGRNPTHVRTLLKFYHQKHINEPFIFKSQFVNKFLSQFNTHEFDDETWNTLNQLFQSMEVYTDSENNVQSCIVSIIVRHVVRGDKLPDIINNRFIFDTMKQYQRKLKKKEEKDAVFNYLYNHAVTRSENQKITTESELEYAIRVCESLLHLLKDWKKDLQDFPYVMKRVKYLVRINQENAWNTSLNLLYNFNKQWKKEMFEESILMCPTVKVCANALKHDAGLLMRHKVEVEAILKNDAVSLVCLINKVRTYWSDSLAEEWKKIYLNSLKSSEGHKALVLGLCTLLNQKQFNDIAKKYAPSQNKIDWNDIDELVLSIQKQLAKNMFKARPLLPLETVLWYAKGDYLHFTVHSLNAILSQLSTHKLREYMPKLLNEPVSLQKFGVRYAFGKLSSQELIPVLTDIWNSTKNCTIRAVLFKQTHAILCKEHNTAQINEIWELLKMFIDNLSTEENHQIYKILGKAANAPACVRNQFYMKSYIFLKSLPATVECESIIRNMDVSAPDMMESLDDEFVANVMLKSIDKKFTKNHDSMYDNGRMFASFVLSCKDEVAATRRYELFLAPLLDRNLALWNEAHEREYHIRINLKDILEKLLYFIGDYSLGKQMIIPVQTFLKIQSKLESALSPQKDYEFLTNWKMAVEYIKLINEHKDVFATFIPDENDLQNSEKCEKLHSELHSIIAPKFAKHCIRLLKEDLDHFYPSIYILFSKALSHFFRYFFSYTYLPTAKILEYLKYILKCSNEKEVYYVVYGVLNVYYAEHIYSDEERKMIAEVRRILSSHPSEELKMYYHQLFHDQAEIENEHAFDLPKTT